MTTKDHDELNSTRMGHRPRGGRRSKDFGLELPITDEWREAAETALERLGLSNLQLAADVGTTDGNVSNILKGKYRSSSLVQRISERLEISYPVVTRYDDPLMNEWLRTLARLRSENPALYASLLKTAQDALQKKK